jgi:hypothetical protein
MLVPSVTEALSLTLQFPSAPDTQSGVTGPVPQVWVAQTGALPYMARQICPAGQVMVTEGLKLWHVVVLQAPVRTCQTLLEQNAKARPLPVQSS